MVDIEEFLRFLKSQNYYQDQIYHIEHISSHEAQFGDLENPLRKRLQRWLEENNLKLWGHQAEAINLINNKNNTVIVTSTASGKSLCYNLPILQSIFICFLLLMISWNLIFSAEVFFTSTDSAKYICYNLPILQYILE